MDDPECLTFYPFVVVRLACRVCSRTGSYRLARLAAKLGPEISLRDLTDRFSYDCLWRRRRAASAAGRAAASICRTSSSRRPPDDPPGLAKLRLIKNT
jgi:hypothetical protein